MPNFQLYPWPARQASKGAPRSLDGESWLPIPECDGKYRVSSAGRVFHIAGQRYLHPKTGPGEQCCRIYLYHRGRVLKLVLSRLVASLFNATPPNRGYFIDHLDADKNNCRADNLRWVARSEIMRHAYWRGVESDATPSTFDVRLFNECMGKLTTSPA